MKLVVMEDIQGWATRLESKGGLSELVSNLVRSTTPVDTRIDIPTGSAIYRGGWDGRIECSEASAFVPHGVSLWEFGTEKDARQKIKSDFAKRDANPLGEDKQTSTLVFVTPREVGNKEQLRREIKEGSSWKDIWIHDSSDLAQWLESSLPVAKWFAGCLRIMPFEGYRTAGEFWQHWSSYKQMVLPPQIVTAGRQIVSQHLQRFLRGEPGITAIRASTRGEAIAFMIAAAKQFETGKADRFLSGTLIIDTADGYAGIHTNKKVPCNLIPNFENTESLYGAVTNGHHVMVPLGWGDPFPEEDSYDLPPIERDGQVEALMKMDYLEEQAHRLSKAAGGDITILKKLLGFTVPKTGWLRTENHLKEIIPAVLVGRWNEKHKGDKEVLEHLSGMPYDAYATVLNKWKNLPESPILQIGENWRLTSPWDVWVSLPPYITRQDLDKLKDCILLAMKVGNPIIEPEPGNPPFSFGNKETTYSTWVREGLLQSLVLVGTYGERLHIPALHAPQRWVDTIVMELLEEADGKLWQSLNYECPLLAEASPDSFLAAVETSLEEDSAPILDMFREREGIAHTHSNHTGLLWALEGLAWLPSCFYGTTKILMRLATIDPGGKLHNRPLNSLHSIFNTWRPQTLVGNEGRMLVLKDITKEEPLPGWKLLMGMLPEHFGVVYPTHKLRWRMFSTDVPERTNSQDEENIPAQVLRLLVDLFDNSEEKLAQLLNASERMQLEDRRFVLEWMDTALPAVNIVEHRSWHDLREILHRHRTRPFSHLSLPESELEQYERLYHKLRPTNKLEQVIWLFNESWPQFPEGSAYDPDKRISISIQEGEVIDQARSDAMQMLLTEYSLEAIMALRSSVKVPGKLGESLAECITDMEQVLAVCATLEDEEPGILFGQRFFYRKAVTEGSEWIKNLCTRLAGLKYSNRAIANVLLPLNQGSDLWKYIASLGSGVESTYWERVHPYFYDMTLDEKIAGLQKLLTHKRFHSAIEAALYQVELLPTEVLMNLLSAPVTGASMESQYIRHSSVNHIFEELDRREDRDDAAIAGLEWLYLSAFIHYSPRRPKLLHKELCANPGFFLSILRWAFASEDQQERDGEELTEEMRNNRRTKAFQLLESWKRIPGVADNNTIDKPFLQEWVNQVRDSAKATGMLSVADRYIGKVLAQFPEEGPQWPAEPIFEVLEAAKAPKLLQHYSCAMYNKRGSSSRAMFAGGDIERGHACFFEALVEAYLFTYPKVAKMFRKRAEGYRADAKAQDNRGRLNKLEY